MASGQVNGLVSGPGTDGDGPGRVSKAALAHGVCMLFAMFILLPLAVLLTRVRWVVDLDAYLHIRWNLALPACLHAPSFTETLSLQSPRKGCPSIP